MIFFRPERLGDFVCCPERLGDFFFPERLGDFFLVPRGWVIFFCPKRLGDFFLSEEVDLFFLSREVG